MLRLDPGAASLQYYTDTGASTKLPFVCELDVATRLVPSGTTRDSGRLLTYADVSSTSPGQPVCNNLFTSKSAAVACRQMGYDGGQARYEGLSEKYTGSGPSETFSRVVVGRNCTGSEPYLEECSVLTGATFATVGYGQCGSDLITFVDCAMRDVATVPQIGGGDLPSPGTDGLTARNTTIVVAVCIVCVLGLVLVATYTVKHYRDKHAPPRRPSQAEPTPDGGPTTGAPPPVSRSQRGSVTSTGSGQGLPRTKKHQVVPLPAPPCTPTLPVVDDHAAHSHANAHAHAARGSDAPTSESVPVTDVETGQGGRGREAQTAPRDLPPLRLTPGISAPSSLAPAPHAVAPSPAATTAAAPTTAASAPAATTTAAATCVAVDTSAAVGDVLDAPEVDAVRGPSMV